MTIKRHNITKIFTVLLALMLVLTGFGPMTRVEAASDPLVANIDKYGFHADVEKKTVGLNSSISVYPSATDAMNRTNRSGVYESGEYFIYKSVNGSINITRTQGRPGGWVNLNHLTARSAEKITIYQAVGIYGNGTDATKRTNWLKNYAAGDYYIYRSTDGAKNITKVPGQPGGWANLDILAKAMVLRKPDFKLTTSTRTYSNAADAIAGKNAVGTYRAGDYFVYKTYGKAINISKAYGKPGAWIVSNAITLLKNRNVYASAAEAVKYNNPSALYTKGVYYIYKETDKAVNISRTEGQPGGWISRSSLAYATGGAATIVEKVDTSRPAKDIVNDFRIVLDAGHGKYDNRGGVLFDEGRQNFIFMEYLIKELKTYPGVEILLTRDTLESNPTLQARATEHKKADVFLSLHTNAAPSKDVRGVEIYGSVDNTKSTMAKEMTAAISKLLGTTDRGLRYRDYYTGNIQMTKSGITRDYYGVMRNNDATNIYLLETVFHTNYADSKAYLDNQQALAKIIADTFAKHYNLQR